MPQKPSQPIGAVVLAGGKSSRLGYDKGLLRINGETLVQWLPSRLAMLFDPVALVVDHPHRYAVSCPQYVDLLPDAGPLAGIAAGLQSLAVPAMFACACDMPLLQPALLQRLCSALGDHDLAIAERGGRLEPLCAVYAASCLPVMQRLLRDRQLRTNGVAGEVRSRIVAEDEWRDFDPEGDSFLSINTPTDLVRLQERGATYGLTITR
ncbi:MAG: molybdenum cofactor guanylyltransferase [Chloroflexota bacterium]